MRPTIVIYKSKYGATQSYAKAIAQRLDTEAILLEQLKEFHRIGEYENVVLCLPIYNGSLAGMAMLKARYYRIAEKNITLLLVGMTDLAEEGAIDGVINRCLSDTQRRKFKIFYAKGRVSYRAMMMQDKFSWNSWIKKIKAIPEEKLNPTQKAMLANAKGRVDFYDEASIDHLVEYVKNI